MKRYIKNRFMNFDFKCRCMPFINQRESITMLMNGAYKSMSHCSLTNLTEPFGLHRLVYRLKDNDLNKLFSDDADDWIPVKYRYRNRFEHGWY